MTQQIKPGYYLAFQTHSKSDDAGKWFIEDIFDWNTFKYLHGLSDRSFCINQKLHGNSRGFMYSNFSNDTWDKASFGWRVKSVKN